MARALVAAAAQSVTDMTVASVTVARLTVARLTVASLTVASLTVASVVAVASGAAASTSRSAWPVGPSLATAAAPAGAPPAARSVTLVGGGFGHGVGMSQYGAYGQAVEGRTAEQILSWYYRNTRVQALADGRDVRVNIAHRASQLLLSTIAVATGGGGWQLGIGGAIIRLGSRDRATVTARTGGLVVQVLSANGSSRNLTGPALRVDWGGARGALAAAPGTVLRVGSDELRHGTLSVLPSSQAGGPRTRLEAVTSLSLHNEYLYGLGEVPSSWPRQALRAQAVAARTYALAALRANPRGIRSCACDLYDTDASQVFLGWRKEGETIGGVSYGARWRSAVDATTSGARAGLAVLDASGRPIHAYYFSSSAGRTRNSEWVWSSPLPYAVSVDDHWSERPANPYASWTVSRSASRVAAAFGLSSLAALAITARDGSGAIESVTATSVAGTRRTLYGGSFASRLGLLSSWVRSATLTFPAATPTPPPTPTSHPAQPPALSLVWTTPGVRTVRGHRWSTTCSRTGAVLRCAAQSYGSWYAPDPAHPGRVVMRSGWRPGAAAYTAPLRAYAPGPFATSGPFRDVAGRSWRVQCVPVSGPRTCTASRSESALTVSRTARGSRVVSTRVWPVRRLVRLLP